MNERKESIEEQKKRFKYWRKCKLPSCGKEFGTNRDWQHFCPGSNHQQEWQRLLRKKHEEVIVEMATVKEQIVRLKASTEMLAEIINFLLKPNISTATEAIFRFQKILIELKKELKD